MLWGKPTWYFLHCLGEKLKDSEFGHIRNQLLKYVTLHSSLLSRFVSAILIPGITFRKIFLNNI